MQPKVGAFDPVRPAGLWVETFRKSINCGSGSVPSDPRSR